jgi:homoserine O-acetyltransferase
LKIILILQQETLLEFFIKGVHLLEVTRLYAIIEVLCGGGIAWEMVALEPTITQN